MARAKRPQDAKLPSDLAQEQALGGQRSVRAVLWRMLPWLRPYWRHCALILLCQVIMVLAILGRPLSLRLVIDHGFLPSGDVI